MNKVDRLLRYCFDQLNEKASDNQHQEREKGAGWGDKKYRCYRYSIIKYYGIFCQLILNFKIYSKIKFIHLYDSIKNRIRKYPNNNEI